MYKSDSGLGGMGDGHMHGDHAGIVPQFLVNALMIMKANCSYCHVGTVGQCQWQHIKHHIHGFLLEGLSIFLKLSTHT